MLQLGKNGCNGAVFSGCCWCFDNGFGVLVKLPALESILESIKHVLPGPGLIDVYVYLANGLYVACDLKGNQRMLSRSLATTMS